MDEKDLIKNFLALKSRMHIFQNMNDADILSITKHIRLVKFKPGEIITAEGALEYDIYYVLKGRYNIVANRKIVGEFGPGNIIGEIASLLKKKRTASTRAIEEVNAFTFQVNYDKELKAPISFCKFYKNIALDIISKLEIANANLK